MQLNILNLNYLSLHHLQPNISVKIKFLKSYNGDAIVIRFNDPENKERIILIDGGVSDTYRAEQGPSGRPEDGALKKFVAGLRKNAKKIDLLILTHIDDDHIAGILKWFNDDPGAYLLISEVWFNSGGLIAQVLAQPENLTLRHMIVPPGGNQDRDTSIPQGIEFGEYIFSKKIWERKLVMQGDYIEKFGLQFRILSPSMAKLEKLLKFWKIKAPNLETSFAPNDYAKTLKELVAADKYKGDTAYPNGSSIAFILTYKTKNLLFLGDSHPSVIVQGLKVFGYTVANPVPAALVKLSHHGSKANTSSQLLKCIDATNYVISTNGRTHQHPHKQLLARLINLKNDCSIYFNYNERIKEIFLKQDKKDFPNFKAIGLENDYLIEE